MEKFTFAVPCLFGLEGLVGEELRRMGLSEVRVEDRRAFFTGDFLDMARANLRLRMGERVMLLLGRFEARTFEALYQGVKALPLEDLIPRDGQPQQPAPLGARLSGHCQKGRRGPAGGQVRPHLAAGDRGRLSDPVLPDEGRLRGLPGHLRPQPSQAGLPGCGQRSAPP